MESFTGDTKCVSTSLKGTSPHHHVGSLSIHTPDPNIAEVSAPLLSLGGRTGRAMHFFSWTSAASVGGGMVEPRWLAWDPDVTLCALAYDDGVTLAAVRPQFKAIAALPIAHATSGIWHKHQLFLVTPTAVVLVFVAAGGGGGRMVGLGGTGDPFVEVCLT